MFYIFLTASGEGGSTKAVSLTAFFYSFFFDDFPNYDWPNRNLKKVDVCFCAFQIVIIDLSSVERGHKKANLRKRPTGRLSPCLWGPELGFTVNTPPSLPALVDHQTCDQARLFQDLTQHP